MDDLLGVIGPRSRISDPQTSHDAAKHAEKFLNSHHEAILAAMRASQRPMAAEEIADACGWATHVQANRRMSELCDRGLIEPTEERHVNRSGRKAVRYRLSPDHG